MSLPQEEPACPAPEENPPVVAAAAAADEPLHRPKLPFWRRVGGEGLVTSIIIHVLLILLAAIWVISTITDQAKKDPNTFATGAGGGANGERAKEFKTRAQPKNPKTMAKMPSRITSKSATASIAVPDMPALNTATLTSGLTGGGSSKGFGGGTGGGIGSGTGIGRGNGKNFVSLFGAKGGITYGIRGMFYDFKQTNTGSRSPLYGNPDITNMRDPSYVPQNGHQNTQYAAEVREFIVTKNWSLSALADKYRAPDPLFASQIFIPTGPAQECPKAYGVENKVKQSRWLAHYKGRVKCPQNAKFRFVGSGDDILVVRWNKKIALDSGYYQPAATSANIYKDFGNEKCEDTHPSKLGRPLRGGPWIEMKKDEEAEIEIAFGEMPGGAFYGVLCIEPQGQGLKLLRFTKDELPEEIRGTKGLEKVGAKIDMQAEGWIFMALKPRL